MSQHFRVVEHVARCGHTRGRPASIELTGDNALRLSVKQYVPKDSLRPGTTGITLIGAHANAFPKELYEPLWDDIYEGLLARGNQIQSVWIADQYNQGQSGVLNEELLGNDPSWWDHGRDLMYMINQFQDEIPHPIVGVGHSMGGTQLAHLALMHPRLFDALVLIDPVIQISNPSRIYALASTYRRDVWPSRQEAAKKFAATPFYQKWDQRVLDKWIEHGLRNLPTERHPDTGESTWSEGPPVTLTTTKAQEVYNFLRPAYHDERMLVEDTMQSNDPRRHEMDAEDIDDFPMYRPEPAIVFRDLERLKPSVQYIFGDTSELSDPSARKQKMESTGTGLGGNGGQVQGRVREVVLDCGHLVPMERTKSCAHASVGFIEEEMQRYQHVEARRKTQWKSLTRRERVEINGKWKATIGPPPQRRKKAETEPGAKL